MAQTVLSVVLEVQPQSAELLSEILQRLKAQEETTVPKYKRMHDAMPLLHFMSLSVCADADYDPVFVLEANFDGPPGPFWGQLEAAYGTDLRAILCCMKRPRDGTAALFDAVTATGSRSPIAPLLEACTIKPAVFHQGNRGLDRARIEREGALLLAARALADRTPALRTQTPVQIHAAVRAALLPQFPWMGDAVAPRIGVIENLMDRARLLGFGLVVVVALLLPGLIAAAIFKTWFLPLFLLLLTLYFGLCIKAVATVQEQPAPYAWLAGLAALLAAAANFRELCTDHPTWLRPAFPGWHWLEGDFWLFVVVLLVFCLALGAIAVIGGIGLWLRRLEQTEPALDSPAVDASLQARIARSEDQTVMNHMISLVHVKPSLLRAVLIRAGLWGLGYLLRVTARDGYLASMRTIHFAHWAIVDGAGRLMFHSNYDGSWESYLDDFIEKAHVGLTLAWTNGIGFPPTRFLIEDGATQGRKFKAWARHSMSESQLWFSAYKDATVNQIERQVRLADGLRKTALTPQEAAKWVLDL